MQRSTNTPLGARRSRRVVQRGVAITAALAILAAGCGGDAGSDDATSPSPSATEAASTPTDDTTTEAASTPDDAATTDDGANSAPGFDVSTLAIGPADLGEGFSQVPLTQSQETSPPDCPALQELELADDVVGVAYETDDGFSQVDQRITSASDVDAVMSNVTAFAECADQSFTEEDTEFDLRFDTVEVPAGQGATMTGTAGGFPFTGQFAAFQAGGHLVVFSILGIGGLPDGVDAADLAQLTIDRANGDAPPASDAPELAAPGEAAPSGDETEASSGSQGTRENPLEIGATATLGDWEVTVDEVNLDASEAIMSANEFNDEPQNGNYALVTLTATYQGDEEGQAGFELNVTMSGADSRQYSDTDCRAVAPEPMSDQPTVENGGTVTGQFCLDYPDEALGGDEVLFVEELISFDENRLFWSLPTE